MSAAFQSKARRPDGQARTSVSGPAVGRLGDCELGLRAGPPVQAVPPVALAIIETVPIASCANRQEAPQSSIPSLGGQAGTIRSRKSSLAFPTWFEAGVNLAKRCRRA